MLAHGFLPDVISSDIHILSIEGRAFDLLDRFLAFGTDPLGRLAQRGMGIVGRAAPLRAFFAGRALGLDGELPRAARRA